MSLSKQNQQGDVYTVVLDNIRNELVCTLATGVNSETTACVSEVKP